MIIQDQFGIIQASPIPQTSFLSWTFLPFLTARRLQFLVDLALMRTNVKTYLQKLKVFLLLTNFSNLFKIHDRILFLNSKLISRLCWQKTFFSREMVLMKGPPIQYILYLVTTYLCHLNSFQILPQVIYNPITAMRFSAMFTFQLQIRGKHCRRPIAVMLGNQQKQKLKVFTQFFSSFGTPVKLLAVNIAFLGT